MCHKQILKTKMVEEVKEFIKEPCFPKAVSYMKYPELFRQKTKKVMNDMGSALAQIFG